MKELSETIILYTDHRLTQETFTESSLFFDIETTGFSSKHHKIYLIGCAYRQGGQLYIKQFFSENIEDETEVLSAFLSLCHEHGTLISFNGLGFDLPFIQERCSQLGILEHLSDMEHIDIFRSISPFKKVLKLSSMKQKSIEQFLSLNREDIYSGGDLIHVYQKYLKEPEERSLYFLQLHNREDVLGMLNILPILSYHYFFLGNFKISQMEVNSYQEYEGCHGLELIFSLTPYYPLPKRISCGKDNIYLSAFQDRVKLRIKIYQGELKYFYKNYRDYYYLPQEDMAIHKSVAFYVDKDFRTRAKAATCYSKKSGRFLPQYQDCFSPYFKLEYHDKISYIEMTEDFISSEEFQKKYVMHLLLALTK